MLRNYVEWDPTDLEQNGAWVHLKSCLTNLHSKGCTSHHALNASRIIEFRVENWKNIYCTLGCPFVINSMLYLQYILSILLEGGFDIFHNSILSIIPSHYQHPQFGEML